MVPSILPCACLFTPCQCARIEGLTPEQRVAEQEALVTKFWRDRAGRIAAAEKVAREVARTAPAARFGMDGQTDAQRSAGPPSGSIGRWGGVEKKRRA